MYTVIRSSFASCDMCDVLACLEFFCIFSNFHARTPLEGQQMPLIDDIIMQKNGMQWNGMDWEESGLFSLSDYSEIYERYLSVFSRDQIMVVNGEELVSGPLQELR